MKKLLLTFGIFLAGIAFVGAQNKADDAATKMVKKLTEVCSLTPDQVTKVQPLAEGFVKARQANKKQYANNPDGMKSANKTNNQNYKAQLFAILTPDQQQKFTTYLAQRKAQKKGGTSTQQSAQ